MESIGRFKGGIPNQDAPATGEKTLNLRCDLLTDVNLRDSMYRKTRLLGNAEDMKD